MKERYDDVEEHLRIQRENLGEISDLHFEIIRNVVYLRRGIQPRRSFRRFNRLVQKNYLKLAKELDTRWIVSICKTYADYGSKVDARNAMLIVLLVSIVKMAETERRFLENPAWSEPKVQELAKVGAHLWDGVNTYMILEGDMPRELFKRIRKMLEPSPVFSTLYKRVLKGAKESDNLLSRLASRNREFFSWSGND